MPMSTWAWHPRSIKTDDSRPAAGEGFGGGGDGMEAGEAGGVAGFDGEGGNDAAVLNFRAGAIGEEGFGGGFGLLFAAALIVVDGQVGELEEATGLHVPAVFPE